MKIMHYLCEVIMPPTNDVEGRLKTIMAPFDESMQENEDYSTKNAFWDFYLIGGRFSSAKIIERAGKEKISEFEDWLKEENITVSGIQFGKPELKPASQRKKVDEKWNGMFPSGSLVECPLFKGFLDQLGLSGKSYIDSDICLLEDCPNIECGRVIIAGIGHAGEIEAQHMECDSFWNGVNHLNTDWDGKLFSALNRFKKKSENYSAEYRERVLPKEDWIVVTIDYHS